MDQIIEITEAAENNPKEWAVQEKRHRIMSRVPLFHYGIGLLSMSCVLNSASAQEDRSARPERISSSKAILKTTVVGRSSCIEILEAARIAFKQGDIDRAVAQINHGLTQCPGNPVFVEFRALILFAKGDYREASTEIHRIMAVGPGWDWATVYNLYPDLETYTSHLRALEAYSRKHPDDTAARFVQAYHYSLGGHREAAIRELEMVVRFEYSDPIAVAMLKKLAQSTPRQSLIPVGR